MQPNVIFCEIGLKIKESKNRKLKEDYLVSFKPVYMTLI